VPAATAPVSGTVLAADRGTRRLAAAISTAGYSGIVAITPPPGCWS